MAGLILTAMRLSRSWEERYWRGWSWCPIACRPDPAAQPRGRPRGRDRARALSGIPGMWFGWSGRSPAKADVATETIEAASVTYVVTDLPQDDYQEYYNGFANRVLWPILHYRLDLAEFCAAISPATCASTSISPSELHKMLRARRRRLGA